MSWNSAATIVAIGSRHRQQAPCTLAKVLASSDTSADVSAEAPAVTAAGPHGAALLSR